MLNLSGQLRVGTAHKTVRTSDRLNMGGGNKGDPGGDRGGQVDSFERNPLLNYLLDPPAHPPWMSLVYNPHV